MLPQSGEGEQSITLQPEQPRLLLRTPAGTLVEAVGRDQPSPRAPDGPERSFGACRLGPSVDQLVADVGSLTQDGIRPQRSIERRRPSPAEQTAATFCPGARRRSVDRGIGDSLAAPSRPKATARTHPAVGSPACGREARADLDHLSRLQLCKRSRACGSLPHRPMLPQSGEGEQSITLQPEQPRLLLRTPAGTLVEAVGRDQPSPRAPDGPERSFGACRREL